MKIIMLTPEWPSAERPNRGWHVYRRWQMGVASAPSMAVFHYRPGRNFREWWMQRQAFKRMVQQYGPAVLHGQWSYSYAIGGRLGVPMLVQFNGSDGNGWPGAPAWVNQANRQWGRWVARQADWSLFPNHHMHQKMGIPERSSVLRPPVDGRIFYPRDRAESRQRLHLAPNDHVWLFAGQTQRPLKRFEFAQKIVAWRQEHATSGKKEVLLVAEDRPQLEMPYFYSAADALLLVSQAEGSSNVAKEALMCGCPVWACPVGDVAEYLSGFPGSAIMSIASLPGHWALQLPGALLANRSLTADYADRLFNYGKYDKITKNLYKIISKHK